MNTKNLPLFFLVLTLVFTLFLGNTPSVQATQETRTFYCLAEDGILGENDDTYLTAQSAVSGYLCDDDGSSIATGQFVDAGGYNLYRSALFFDTSFIPDLATINSTVLSLYIYGDSSVTDFNITVQNGQPTYPHMPIVNSDYWKDHYSGNGGNRSTATISGVGWWNITLNSDGRSWINLDGNTKLFLRSSRDISASEPSGDEFVTIRSYEFGETYAARLYVTYDVAPYNYMLYGAYSEEGYRDGAINVTLDRPTQSRLNFTLDGDYTAASEDVPAVFHFELGYNQSRVYYVYSSFESIYVFKASEPYYTYYFSVIDFVGITNGHLETLINVNGTDRIVERWKLDILEDLPFTLSWGVAYKVKLVCDEGTYVFGTIVAGAKSEYTFVVSRDIFPEDAIHTGNITVSASRPEDTHIRVSYQDTENETQWVLVAIYEFRGSIAIYTENNTGSSQVVDWYSALPTTDYWVTVTASHSVLNTLKWSFSTPAPVDSDNPFDLDMLGTFPVESTQIFGFIIVVLVFACGSYANASVAIILGTIIAMVLTYINWLYITWTWLSLTFAIAILSLVSIHRRKSEREF